MRISENPIIHYGAIAGGVTAILVLAATLGVNITPPWETAAQAGTLDIRLSRAETMLAQYGPYVLQQQLDLTRRQFYALAQQPNYQGKDSNLWLVYQQVCRVQAQIRAVNGFYLPDKNFPC